MITLLYSTRMRTSEVLHLKQKDIALYEGRVIITAAKFNKKRCIPLDTTMFQLLQKYVMTMISYPQWNNSDFFFVTTLGIHTVIYTIRFGRY